MKKKEEVAEVERSKRVEEGEEEEEDKWSRKRGRGRRSAGAEGT